MAEVYPQQDQKEKGATSDKRERTVGVYKRKKKSLFGVKRIGIIVLLIVAVLIVIYFITRTRTDTVSGWTPSKIIVNTESSDMSQLIVSQFRPSGRDKG
jgi:putative exporter of polyketide antibiotics